MKFSSKLAALLSVLALCAGTLAAQDAAKPKAVKDQMEYDIFTLATKEPDPAKKIQHLLTWKEKYPESDFKNDRLVLMITTYQALRDGEKMLTAAQELLKNEPRNVSGLYYVTLLTRSLNNTAADRLELGEKAANGLLGTLPETFDAAKKPAGVTDDVWRKEKEKLEIEALKTLAFIQMAKKNFPGAVDEYNKILKLNCTGAVSYQLSTALLQQRKPELQFAAMYHVARAAHYTGEDALAPDVQKQVQAYFEKIYVKHTGRKEGMQEVIDLTKKSCFPPDDFKIQSEAERMALEEEEQKKNDPQKYLWTQVKKALIAADGSGAAYFEQIKGAALPKLKGTIVSVAPAKRPKELTIAISTADTPEIKLVVDAAYANEAPAGTVIEFEGAVPTTFSSDPFLVTAEIEKAQITGYPAPAAPAKKAVGKKGGKKK
ncbi:MAG: hypothetical protein J0L64_21510 [Acidobacteria bacterium]|nr:hypothetical protein [Acidobacteriota bacterium]